MGLGIWDSEWLAQNSQRRYPLTDQATAKDVTGAFQLPDDLVLDLIWSTHITSTTDPSKFQLLSVTVGVAAISLTFGYNGTAVASVNVTSATHTPGQVYNVVGASGTDFYDSQLSIVIGRLDNILTRPVGTWTFDLAGARLTPTAVRPDVRGVSGIVLITGVQGQDTSEPLQGEVELAAGSNIRLTVSTVSGRKRIRIDAIDGEGLNESCECGGASLAPPVRRINGIPPDADGNFTFEHDDCLAFDEQSNGIRVRELCAAPCCGCDELQVVTQAADELTARIAELETIATQLQATISQMQSVILVSKFGSQGACPT